VLAYVSMGEKKRGASSDCVEAARSASMDTGAASALSAQGNALRATTVDQYALPGLRPICPYLTSLGAACCAAHFKHTSIRLVRQPVCVCGS